MPEISIITPAYIDSHEKLTWLREMLQSLKSQRFTDWEAIIIDDCSPLSLDSLKAEFNELARYRFLRTSQQGGPCLARNTAVALAEAEALLPLDADDLLADEDVLAAMYGAWETDHNRVVYGDIQRLENGQRGRVFNLPEYTFQRSLDFNGIMPVTALHSKEAHLKAGGWKAELAAGLEDVEYWIACGKAGFCGHRIGATTLLYRRHETSRSFNLRMVNRQETEMRNKILELHRDVYEGRLPMGCCGGGGSSYIPPQSMSGNGGAQSQSISTPLNDFPDGQKQWTQYLGNREGSWGVVGEFTGIHYTIDGPGHKFEVHLNDLPKFRRSGRGRDFAVDVPAPIELIPVTIEIPAPPENGRYQPPEPRLAQVERLDEVAARSRGVEQPAPVVVASNGQATYDLSGLDLGEKVQQMLEAESWTVEKLAEADPEELEAYPGIGKMTSKRVVDTAKWYLDNARS